MKKKSRNNERNKTKYFFVFSLLFMLLISSSFAAAQASWTRVWCNYDSGSGGSACDSGQVGGNTASCNVAAGTHCEEEGWVFCYGQSSCSEGVTNAGPTPTFEVIWDSDSVDCTCLVGAGRWNIGFESGTSASCCGDDGGEFKRTRVCTSGCTSDPNDDMCCNAVDKCVYSNTCYNNGACNGVLKCVGGSWEDHCANTIMDCDEEDVDCGGADCEACGNIDNVYWTNMIGEQITATDLGDTLVTVAETSSAEGKQIDFALWEEPGRCYDVDPYATVVSVGGIADSEWQAESCGGNQFKFKAYVDVKPTTFLESPLLAVNPTEDNNPPIAIISEPLDGDIFSPGVLIDFVSSSYDIDDHLDTWTWDFAGDAVGSGETETYSWPPGKSGPKVIKLTVKDTRNEVNQTSITILIDRADKNDPPAAIISEPTYGEVFSGLLITFDATKTVDDETPFDDLLFHWDFPDGSSYEKTGGEGGAYFTKLFSSAGDKTVRLIVTDDDADPASSEVEVFFSIKGCKIPLDGGYEFVPVGSCSAQSKHYYCEDESTWYDTMVENCEGTDGIAGTIDDCCPRGYYCPNVGGACTERETSCDTYGTQGECEAVGCIWLGSVCSDPLGMTSCSDYPAETSCNNDVLALGRVGGTGLGTDICGQTFGEYIVNASSCHCEWDPGESACKFVYNTNKIIGGDEFITCLKSFDITDCLEGKQTLTWTAICQDGGTGDCGTAEADEQCNSGLKEVKCGAPVSKLGFFSFFNLIMASLILVAYYFLLIRRGERRIAIK